MTRKLRRVPKDKKTGLPKKYLSGAKNKSAKAAEIKRTAEAYRKGQGAFLSSGSRNVPMPVWAMARVNSYMRGGKARTVDSAIYTKYNKKR